MHFNDCFICKHLSDEEIITAFNLKHFSINNYTKNSVIHFEGDACNYFEILLEGSLTNLKYDEFGNEFIIKTFKPSDIIGGNILFARKPIYPLSFIAKDDSKVFRVDKDYIFHLFTKKENILKDFLYFLSERNLELAADIKIGEKKSLRFMIMEYLNKLKIKSNSDIIELDVSKTFLASQFKFQRTSLSRELKKMKDIGLISLIPDTKKIKIK